MSASTAPNVGNTAPQPIGSANLTPVMLNHAAWVTHDVEATAKFYTEIMGMELASTVFGDNVLSTGDAFPYFHLFFRMQDGSTIAFFETPGLPPRPPVSHPAYNVFDHIALQAKDQAEVERWADWLRANGVELRGPIDHVGLVYSIYFSDPNGIRLEITTPIDPEWNQHVAQGKIDLDLWIGAKRRAKEQGRDEKDVLLELIHTHNRH